jgi:putative redox protein
MENYKALFEKTRTRLQNGDAKNPISVSVSSQCTGGFRSKVSIRDFELIIDQPKGFGGSNSGPKPSEIALAALASCQEVTYRLYADALSIPLNGVRVELTGTQDLRGFLGMDINIGAGFQEIRGAVYLDSSAPDADLERLHQTVEQHCPVMDDLRRPVDVEIEMRRDSET